MHARILPSIFAGFFALLAMALNGPVAAQPYGPAYRYERGIQPLDRLLPGIRREHPGDFYDAEGPTYGPSGDPHYHLKWMTPDGRVIWFDADARNGRVLRTSPGRDGFDNHRFEGGGPPPPGYGRPYGERYAPYADGPGRGFGRGFDRGYARPRNFGPGPGYDRGYRDFGGRGGGRWRR
ncbi:MAG: hypothetical protein U1E93_13015 [Alphaproteobacteria bacterium]